MKQIVRIVPTALISIMLVGYSHARTQYQITMLPGYESEEGVGAMALGGNGYVLMGTYGDTVYHNGTTTKLSTGTTAKPWCFAINNVGTVAGCYDSGNYYQAAIWTNGAMQKLDVGGISSYALGVSNDNSVVGERTVLIDNVSVTQGWIWKNGVLTILERPYGRYAATSANFVNDSGVITGKTASSNGNYYFHGAVWSNGKLTDIGVLSSSYKQSRVDFMSAAGNALVNNYIDYFNDSRRCTAAQWKDGVFTALPTNGYTYTTGIDMNSSGVILYNCLNWDQNSVAYIWDQKSNPELLEYVLQGTAYHNAYPIAVNEAGQLLIYGYRRNSQGVDREYAMLLTPMAVPEPASLIAIGTLVPWLIRRRRRVL